MPIPVADAIALLAKNSQERLEKLVEQIDESVSKMFSFPLSVGFSKKEDIEVLKQVAAEYQKAGYNVLLIKNTSSSDNAYVLYLNHGTPYVEKGSHVLIAC